MGDYHSERYRRDTPWRADENRRDDDLGDPWEDNRGSRWLDQDEDWQPESYGESWEDARRRQRLTPGQLSEGGPAPSGYRGGPSRGADLRYGQNGGYGSSPEEDEAWRRTQYRRRQYASEYGDYGDLDDERRYTREGNRGEYGFGSADQAWLRDAQRREPPYPGHRAYFNELRSDTRYWTEPRDEWGGSRPPYHAQRYGRDYLGSRHYDEEFGYAPKESWRDEPEHGQAEEEHGALYNLGHRIGQAVSDWFGPGAMEKRSGPRGYTRTDERIRDEVCERLTFATGLDVRDVSVDVEKGKVTLGGTVWSRSEKYDIEDLVDNTFGVTEIENNIRVRRQEVEAAVKGAGGFNGW